jgi:hypothetical protein
MVEALGAENSLVFEVFMSFPICEETRIFLKRNNRAAGYYLDAVTFAASGRSVLPAICVDLSARMDNSSTAAVIDP